MSNTLKATGVEAKVCLKIAKRQQLGVLKYGTTVRNNMLPILQWLQHAQEEMLDGAIYMERLQEILAQFEWRETQGTPDYMEHCFTCIAGMETSCGMGYKSKGKWYTSITGKTVEITPTHWMPFPAVFGCQVDMPQEDVEATYSPDHAEAVAAHIGAAKGFIQESLRECDWIPLSEGSSTVYLNCGCKPIYTAMNLSKLCIPWRFCAYCGKPIKGGGE